MKSCRNDRRRQRFALLWSTTTTLTTTAFKRSTQYKETKMDYTTLVTPIALGLVIGGAGMYAWLMRIRPSLAKKKIRKEAARKMVATKRARKAPPVPGPHES